MCVTGDASVMPYPWRIGMPVDSVKRRARSGASGAAPHFTQRRLMLARKLSRIARVAISQQRWRHAEGHGDAFVHDRPQRCLAVEARHQHDGAAADQAEIQADRESVDVVQRQKTQDDVVFADAARFARRQCLVNVGDDVVMREHHALGQSGGAAGEGQASRSSIASHAAAPASCHCER